MKSIKNLQKNQKIFILFGTVVLVWLVLLTVFAIWAWEIHIWQARVDSESIFRLMVENGEQQIEIDALKNRG